MVDAFNTELVMLVENFIRPEFALFEMPDAQFAFPEPSVHESFEIFEKLGWSIKK